MSYVYYTNSFTNFFIFIFIPLAAAVIVLHFFCRLRMVNVVDVVHTDTNIICWLCVLFTDNCRCRQIHKLITFGNISSVILEVYLYAYTIAIEMEILFMIVVLNTNTLVGPMIKIVEAWTLEQKKQREESKKKPQNMLSHWYIVIITVSVVRCSTIIHHYAAYGEHLHVKFQLAIACIQIRLSQITT